MDHSNPHFSVVYTAHGKLDAEMIKIFLESSGIPALLVQESAGIALGLTVASLGTVVIMVPMDREAEARKLLDALDHGDFELDFSDGDVGFPEED